MKRVCASLVVLLAFCVVMLARAQSAAPLPAISGDILITGSGFRATIVPGRSITIYADHKRVNVRPAVIGDESVIEVNTSPQILH